MPQFQASESQESFAKSFFDPDLLQPDGSLEPPSSQPTVASIPISDFTHPIRHSRAPASLERVGPTLQKFWVLYNIDGAMEDSRKQFVDWWLMTEFGSKKDVQTTIRWDGKKKSDIWERFDQVAHDKTGEPKVMCKHCHATIVHPNHHRAGSSPMKGHITTSACRSKPSPTKQRIDQLLRDSVSLASPTLPTDFTNVIKSSYMHHLTRYSTRTFLRRNFLNSLHLPGSPFGSSNIHSSRTCSIWPSWLILSLIFLPQGVSGGVWTCL
jgi:hypothetical protein